MRPEREIREHCDELLEMLTSELGKGVKEQEPDNAYLLFLKTALGALYWALGEEEEYAACVSSTKKFLQAYRAMMACPLKGKA